MDFSSLYEQEQRKSYSWPDIFYAETEPRERFKLLDMVLNSGEATQEDYIRKEILNIRYSEGNKASKTGYVDNFLRVMLDFIYFGSKKSSITSPKLIKKNIEKSLNSIQYDEMLEKDDVYKELFQAEVQAMGNFYIYLCESDKQYNSFLLGLGTIKRDKLESKIAKDFYSSIYVLSKNNDMFNKLYIWNKALLSAFQKNFPNWEKLFKAQEK